MKLDYEEAILLLLVMSNGLALHAQRGGVENGDT
jgi:hypothetical protein